MQMVAMDQVRIRHLHLLLFLHHTHYHKCHIYGWTCPKKTSLSYNGTFHKFWSIHPPLTFQIFRFLKALGMQQYEESFKQEGVNGNFLFTTEYDKLAEALSEGLNISCSLHVWSLLSAMYAWATHILMISYRRFMKVYPHISIQDWRWNLNGVLTWLKERGLDCFLYPFQKYCIHGALLFTFNEEFSSLVFFNMIL